MVAAGLSMLLPTIEAQGLTQKEAFNNQYPKQFVFRGEYKDKQNSSYLDFSNSAVLSCGFIQKYVPYDELSRIHPTKTAEFASRYVKEHPEKLVLLHWDAEEHVNTIPESMNRYFPGHWYTYQGSRLMERLTANDQWIKIENIKPFNRVNKSSKARSKWFAPMLLLVEIDTSGKPVWEHYEYIEIEEIDAYRNAIKVKRAQALSKASTFEKGTRVAPIATYVSSSHLFAFNYSTCCPKDKNGKTATDVQFEELVELFAPKKGVVTALNGIAFDVLNWTPPHNREIIDSNGDGKADRGLDPVTGEDLWTRGAYAFQKRLREHFGSDFIMTNDSYSRVDQRAVGVFDGVESEGLVRHNDSFRGFSKTINVFSYWAENNPTKYPMANFVPKIMNPVDKNNAEKYVRLCTATATCLGAAINTAPILSPDEVSDEMKGGKLNKPFWLGKPLGKMHNFGLEGKDLLSGEGVRMDDTFVAQWNTQNCFQQSSQGVMKVSGDNKNSFRNNCKLEMSEFKVPEEVNDITVTFEIKALEGLRNMDSLVPRMVYLKVGGLPDYEGNTQLNDMYNDMWGLCAQHGYSQMTFYYRNVAGCKLNIALDVEGQGDFSIRNFRINASAGAIARAFENGIVLVNPSLKDYTFELSKISGSKGYKRIDGKKWPNSGQKVGEKVTLESLDAIFLIKSDSSISN